jgi:hypothetical protein
MTNRLVASLLLGTMTLLAASSSQKADCEDQLPLGLRELAKGIGCGPVPGVEKGTFYFSKSQMARLAQ